jgi:large subunit ribosomal protein L24
MQKIKKGDLVQVITGNEIGMRGEVDAVLRGWRVDAKTQQRHRAPNQDRVRVRGVNLHKKHQKRVSQTRTQTGIIERESPLHISNVLLVCPHCDAPTRTRVTLEGNSRIRVCKRCNAPIDKAA